MASLLDLYATLSIDTGNYEQGLQQAGQQAQNFSKSGGKLGSTLQGAGKAITGAGKALMPLTGALVGMGIASGKMAISFDDSMANINTLLDDDSHLESYGNTIKTLSKNTGIELGTMSDGMYQAISSLGDSGAETEQIFGRMAVAAKAGGAEVSDSVSLISAGMKGYNSVNDQTAKKISDLAFQTAKLGVTTFPEMAKSMQPLFPLSSSLNISYEELFGTMATLTGVTGNTSEVSTQFKAVLSNLMKPTESMSKLISKYGYENAQAMIETEGLSGVLKIIQDETGGQADKMGELFSSTEAVTAMTALTGAQFDNFNMKLGEMENATGATQAAYEKLNTAGDSIRKSWNMIKVAGTELGGTILDMLAPAMEWLAQKVEEGMNWFGSLSEEQKKTIVVIGAVVAAIGPVLMIIGTLVSGIGTVITVVSTMSGVISAGGTVLGALTAAFGAVNIAAIGIVGGIAAAIAIGVALYRNWDTIKAKAGELATQVSAKWTQLKTNVVNKANEVKTQAVNKFNELKTQVTSKVEELKTQAVNKFNALKTDATNKIDALKSTIGTSFQEIKSKITTPIEEAKTKFTSVVEGIKSTARNIFSGIVPKLHLSLPHVSVEGGEAPWGIMGMGRLPSFHVTWNRKAMNTPYLLDGATLFGINDNGFLGGGEAGKEVIYGHESLMRDIRNATGENKSSEAILEYILNGGLVNDIKKALDGMDIKWDDRELGRLVESYA